MALAVALTVALLIGWSLTLLFGGESDPEAAERLPAQAAPAAEKQPAADKPAAQPEACPDSALRVVAEAGRPEFKAGEKISLSMVVTNTGPAPCVRDLNRVHREIEVLGADDRHVWSSSDCFVESTNEKPVLEPGQSARNDIVWSGLTSTPDCGPDRKRVQPGEYKAVAKLAEITSEPVPFKVVPGR